MKYVNQLFKGLAILPCGILVAAGAGCNDRPAPVASSPPAGRIAMMNVTDAQRLSDGASKLIDAMKKPTESFHFSYMGQENINNQYPGDRTQAPSVGPVSLQADISPEEISVKETRGSTPRTSTAKFGNDIDWSMANLETLGVMTKPTLVIAVGASVTSPPSSDLVGTVLADKFIFDSATATASPQKEGLARARLVMTTIQGCKGTAWIAKDSGVLIKFNIDADYLDKNNHAWKEHYEGDVTPK